MQQVPRDAQSVLSQPGADGPPTTVAQVLSFMEELDAALPVTDGVKWFNHDRPLAHDALLRVLDRLTGFAGRGPLIPV